VSGCIQPESRDRVLMADLSVDDKSQIVSESRAHSIEDISDPAFGRASTLTRVPPCKIHDPPARPLIHQLGLMELLGA